MSKVVKVFRTVGIALGSLVAAYLAFMLVAGSLFGWNGKDSPLAGFLVVVLGGLVFADIMRRDRRPSASEPAPSA
jgi:polyferredoxin